MKNNKLTNILLIVLMILSIGLITYIFIDKDDKTNDDKNDEIKEQENNTVTNSVSKALNIYDTIESLAYKNEGVDEQHVNVYFNNSYELNKLDDYSKKLLTYYLIENKYINENYYTDNDYIFSTWNDDKFIDGTPDFYINIDDFSKKYKELFKENLKYKENDSLWLNLLIYIRFQDDKLNHYSILGGITPNEEIRTFFNNINKIEETDKNVYIYDNSLLSITDNEGNNLKLVSNYQNYKNDKLISDLSKINEYNENKIEKEELLEYYKNDLSTFKHTFKKENGNVYYEKTELVK